jgi:hypothetical protein
VVGRAGKRCDGRPLREAALGNLQPARR